MPYLLPAFAALVGTYGTAIAVAIEVGVTVASLAAMAMLSKLLEPSPPGSQLSSGATEEYTGTVEPRRIVYGYNLVSGLNVIPPWCHGTNNQYLDQVLVLAGHEVAAITDYADQELIASAHTSARFHAH